MSTQKTRITRTSSLSDRSAPRGVGKARANRKRRPARGRLADAKGVAVRIARIVLGIGIAVGIGYGAFEGRRYAITSPTFAVEEVTVVGQARSTEDALIRLSGVRAGDNLFQVDTEEVARTVEAHPWVASAEVTRRFPRRLEIAVEEHTPAVLVALEHLYYADVSGEIVKRYSPGERERFVVVTGLDRARVEADDPASRALLVSSIRFLRELSETLGDEAPELAEINLDPVLGLSFVEVGGETTVSVGYPPWQPRIARLGEVRRALAARQLTASEITLGGERRPERVVTRLAQGARAGQ